MLRRFRSRLTYANIMSSIAVTVALGTGGAYAANTIGSSDVIDESLLSQDVKNGEVKNADIGADAMTSSKLANGSVQNSDLGPDAVTTSKIKAGNVLTADLGDLSVSTGKLADGAVGAGKLAAGAVTNDKLADGAVTSAKVLDDNQAGGGLGPADLATNSVAQAEIATDGVAATEIQNDSIDAGEIVDFGLTNQDIGVLFAEVDAAGAVSGSSGSVTTTKIGAAGTGQYEVDFGRNITACTAVATIGPAGNTPSSGQVNVADRAGNTEAVFVDTNDSGGSAADRPFRLVVVC